mmetsp:Transcript_42193/g.47133  ORF Transcript_42193/g.47133 Transcript_42193/m.47133 type:complete len:135 (-) Transcript_42193:223-627(-)
MVLSQEIQLFFPTMADTIDITSNTTDNTTDNDAEEIPQSTSSPVGVPPSAAPTVSMQQTNPLQEIANVANSRPTIPTFTPTTFLPTVTFEPTKFFDWTTGAGRRNEPDLSPSAIDENAPIDGRSQRTHHLKLTN